MDQGNGGKEKMKVPKFKVVLLGNRGVGKLALVERFVEAKFYKERYKTRLGIQYFHIKQCTMDEQEVKLEIWDNHYMDEHIRFIVDNILRGVTGIILVYDATNDISLSNLESWIERCRENVGLTNIPMILVGCKADLKENRYPVYIHALEFAKKHDLEIDDVFECSAKTGENVELIFTTLAKKIIEREVDKN